MLLLILFAFVGGVVTVLSPCILPLLPIILSTISGNTTDKKRPYGIITGFILSFTIFTLFLSSIVKFLNIPSESLRNISVFVIGFFGITLVIPKFQEISEKLFSKLSSFSPRSTGKEGYFGGIIIGASLGLLWTPCVGPILAGVISLAISGNVTLEAFFVTLAYSTGTAIPMLLIMLGGQNIFANNQWLLKNSKTIQKMFGVLMIVSSIAIYFNIDRNFQTYILKTFPNYGAGLTKFEENAFVKNEMEVMMEPKLLEKGLVAPELIPGGGWLNSKPLTLSELKGKVVIVDFWTYSCINCQRTLPYLVKWYDKYKDKGLVIIGAHSPEFEFEKSPKNLQKAIKDFGITYPVMQDNNFDTWQAYKNRYWPAKYFLDKDGYIRYYHFGEGGYDESEKVIQMLLEDAGADKMDRKVNNPVEENFSGTPETYLGYERIERYASPEIITKEGFAEYSLPEDLPTNSVAFKGWWNLMPKYSNAQKGSELHLNYSAKDVYLVMRPKDKPSKVKIYLDGQFVKEITVTDNTLYKLIENELPGRHMLKIEFLDSGTEVYAFTFG